MFGITYQIVYIFLVPLIECRKFDMDSESKKLFGEDLKSVLKRFRRTPEYVKILKHRMLDFDAQIGELALYTLNYYDDALQKRVNEKVGLNETDPSKEHEERISRKIRNLEKGTNDNEDIIDKLDNYHEEQSKMPVQEKNSFVDLGFEYAGRIIHTLIKNLESNGGKTGSTKLDVDPDIETTTQHVEVHEVTTETPETQAEGSTAGVYERGGMTKRMEGRTAMY